jgi:hypothetical protein
MVRGSGVLALAATMMLAFAPSPARASAGEWVPAAPYVFPSSTSTVIASIGFINETEVGYFWSANLGHSVAQSYSGPASVDGIQMKVSVVQNVLNNGAHVDWTVSVNAVDVARFRVNEGFTGTLTVRRLFAAIAGPNYDVKIRVRNVVAGGEGSITLAYAGAMPHGFLFHT